MQDITLMGATYLDVPAVELPKTGGGTASFTDVTDTTAVASDVAQGKYFYLANGTKVAGTSTGGGGGGYVTQDQDGYIVLPPDGDGGGESITVEPLSVTQNGTYTAPSGKAYSPVTVNVSGGGTSDFKRFIERTTTNPALPSDLTSIGSYAFAHYTNLALTELPSGVTSIGEHAFENCENMALAELPDGVSSIGSYAFANCTNLALAELPSGVTYIYTYAFYNCPNLVLNELPDGVISIGSYAFNRCSGLISISCEGRIVTLGANAFLGSSTTKMQLKSVSFPNMALASNLSTVFGSTSSGYACEQLEFADIGSTAGIATNAFANCYKLQTLVLRKSSVCTLANVTAFLNTPMRGYNSLTGTVYVPSDLISSYQTATNWSTLYNNGTVTFVAIEGSEYEL